MRNKIVQIILLSVPGITIITAQTDYDCFIGEETGNVNYYERQNSGAASTSFSAVTGGSNPLNGEDVGMHSSLEFVDIDGDGDQDCFIGGHDGLTYYYKNTGSSSSPTFVEWDGNAGSADPNPFYGVDVGIKAAPAFVDIDGDGDYDCFIGENDGNINYYKNTGNSTSPTFTLTTGSDDDPFDDVDVGTKSTPVFVDIDGDGDYDCFIGEYNGSIKYYRNTGNSSSATFTVQTGGDNPFNGVDDGSWSKPAFVNIDGDAVLNTVSISGTSGFRMMSSPVSGTIYSDLLAELWIQGMTGGDVTSGDANVWTYSVAGQSWSALSNLSTASLTAGAGFLVYVYADTDNDGDDDLAVTLSVNGTANNSSATVGSIADGGWALIGNLYVATIDWDDVSKTNLATSAYVYDNAKSGGAGYISWNGSAGSLSNGLIAPFQGFWVQASGGTGSITIDVADKSTTAGTFYKTMNDSTGSMSFAISSGEDYEDNTFVSFMTNGEAGMDNADAYKLLPMTASERVVGISYAEGNGLDISNLPYVHEGSIAIPLDVMYLTVDADYNFVTNENDVTMTWDISSLPGHVSLTLTDNATGTAVNLTEESEIIFSTEAKGSFPAYGSGGVNIYPQVGESRFTLTVAYSTLTSNDEPANVPGTFALRPAYPNPFNPSTTISFDIPDATDRNTSLYIYDITGKLVETLINKVLPSGSHAVTWDPKNLSAGLYIVQLKASNKTFNQKLTFLK
ncbi:MAG: hypothetical protein CMG32_06790 [Candidatus Marinimicrobia bacterium]|jgi:hypothetical protein|nr:hypothetical protein [Candidatus Neomarinimicrobiota bacterium]MEE1572891.1 T9SS type A sorting domain-containing protein [Candidatus Neomarinimicrobiota bacterium]